METEMARDVESARLFRLLTKLSTVVDRAELNGDESWSEYGDRYMLKLFRDYVFHQVGIQSYFSRTWPTLVGYWATKGKWKEWVLLYKQKQYNKTLQPYVAFLRLEKYNR